MTETSTSSIESFEDRIKEVIKGSKSSVLTGHRMSGDPVKYAFYLRKPLFPIGLPFQYKTALIATFKRLDDKTVIETSIQKPPFVTISMAFAVNQITQK